MLLTIHLPPRDEILTSNRQRWAEVLSDAELAKLPGRIETNAFGIVLMSPPPGGPHCVRQYRIARLLQDLLCGQSMTECPISTIDGVKACDAAWYSDDRYEKVRGQQAFELAPEICVEVVSPANSDAELQYKRDLYFEAGAVECWQCDAKGVMSYYLANHPDTPRSISTLCPNFPALIND